MQVDRIKRKDYTIDSFKRSINCVTQGLGRPVQDRRRLTPTVRWTKTADATDFSIGKVLCKDEVKPGYLSDMDLRRRTDSWVENRL